MADTTTLTHVKIEALVISKLTKHCATNPTSAYGAIVGMDNGSTLEITNAFPFPTADNSSSDSHNDTQYNSASGTPRTKASQNYQNEMVKMLKEVNVDANNVGWYTSANLGNFVTSSFIDNQYHYQSQPNERAVALVHDVSRSAQGALSMRAFRLSKTFMDAYKAGTATFTTETLQKSKLNYKDILVELPIIIHNSHLLTTFLHQLPSAPPKQELAFPSSLAELEKRAGDLPLYPNLDMDLSIDPFLEKSSDLLLESIESHYTELNNFQYYQRQLAREQAKITAWKQKRAAENAIRASTKQPQLPEDEWQKEFKLPVEPSRLEGMLLARQVEQYSRQVDGFTATVTSKMFAVKSNLIPDNDG